jgi:hypothetical protein
MRDVGDPLVDLGARCEPRHMGIGATGQDGSFA